MEITQQLALWTNEFLPVHLFLVEIEKKVGSNKIIVSVDGDTGISIDECRKLSKHLSAQLDEANYGDVPYTLEVSSPGAEKPLKILRQYPKHVGREIKITLKQQTELLGKLEKLENEELTLRLKDAKKDYKAKEVILKTIHFEDIKEAIVQISFN
jgi:ribosome maturation factor RimP